MKVIEGSITAPKGYKATGNHVGVKRKRRDLAIIYSEVPANAAAGFTTNVVKAAPLLWCEQIINNNLPVRAIVVNSGNANACTGELGIKHVEIMAETLANCLDTTKEEVLVSSTGVIGVNLPIEKILDGINNTYSTLDNTLQAANQSAQAIMTTDTFPKEIAVEILINNKIVKIGGIAKGSGMIHPNMATMLSFITTDINISSELLNKALKESIVDTYNMISVDRDTSTNDMVVLLANAQAENPKIECENKDYNIFKNALDYVNTYLAQQIVKDGEGVSKFLEIYIKGVSSKDKARKLARSVTTSNLVKTAFFGEDANWGRILAAMGYAGVEFNPQEVTMEFVNEAGSVTLMQNGMPVAFDEKKASEILKNKEIQILISLKEGTEEAKAWGCDLTYEYVRINGEYRT